MNIIIKAGSNEEKRLGIMSFMFSLVPFVGVIMCVLNQHIPKYAMIIAVISGLLGIIPACIPPSKSNPFSRMILSAIKAVHQIFNKIIR